MYRTEARFNTRFRHAEAFTNLVLPLDHFVSGRVWRNVKIGSVCSMLAARFRKDDQERQCGDEEMSRLRSPGATQEEALQQHIDSGLIAYQSDFVSMTIERLLIADLVTADFLSDGTPVPSNTASVDVTRAGSNATMPENQRQGR